LELHKNVTTYHVTKLLNYLFNNTMTATSKSKYINHVNLTIVFHLSSNFQSTPTQSTKIGQNIQ